ncbi:MAG: ABC transporter ATP-binding protein [Spongiibacteraceae bacterium]|nr:ABC transporter ATP-binding protein [Spongiibacteraceae bacterium]
MQSNTATAEQALLTVENLSVNIGSIQIINNVSFSIARNQCVGIVGESGSGKSTLALSLVGMVGNGKDATINGAIEFDGRRIDQYSNKQLRTIRGKEIAVILQDPMSSLNPVLSIGNQLAESLTCHQQGREKLKGKALQAAMIAALSAVHIPAPEQRLLDYPHQMSGGMRQRIVGAMAIAPKPQLLIADEPTTSLDAILQVQYLQLLKELQAKAANTERQLSVLLITHDFGAVAKCCDRVCVMYAGELVESADTISIFENPAHPYTAALMASRPQTNSNDSRLPSIAGFPPRAGEKRSGCQFAPRCSKAKEKCLTKSPPLSLMAHNHHAACWYPNGGHSHG